MPSSPRRGRPPEVDRHQVALAALRLFERDGFDEVSMDDVARAAEVSRRTLFRLFPSKADLVWDGVQEVLAGVRARAAGIPAGAPLGTVVEALFGEGLRALDDPGFAQVARRRLRLIASSPSLLTHAALEAIQEAIEGAIGTASWTRRAPTPLVARTLFAVGFSALVWWAQSDGAMSPAEVLGAALGALSEASTR